ncbi:MAG: cytochrome c [Verrucomicrobiota bacterium JB023]|nr:cytochrome c [Verrucomicrobiota bacterium JB023]
MSENDSNQSRPDLDENLNVSATHGNLKGTSAAALREKRVHENGMEPVPLWIFLVAGLALLVGGAVLGQGGKMFAYNSNDLWADEFKPFEGGAEEEVTSGPALKSYIAAGSKIYTKCTGCHGADGKGDGANYPPIAGSEWVTGDNTEALAMIILNGVQGPIDVAGKTWNNMMPSQALGLGAKELAALMTYLRSSLNDVGDVVSIEMAEEAMKQYAERGEGKPTTQSELKPTHMKHLPGELLAPDALVDFETLLPAADAGGNG